MDDFSDRDVWAACERLNADFGHPCAKCREWGTHDYHGTVRRTCYVKALEAVTRQNDGESCCISAPTAMT